MCVSSDMELSLFSIHTTLGLTKPNLTSFSCFKWVWVFPNLKHGYETGNMYIGTHPEHISKYVVNVEN